MKRLVILVPFLLGSCGDLLFHDTKQAVRDTLKDPDSALFEDLKACSNDNTVVSGKVNAKNSYGGYTGYKLFYYMDHQVITSDQSEMFDKALRRCFGPKIMGEVDREMKHLTN